MGATGPNPRRRDDRDAIASWRSGNAGGGPVPPTTLRAQGYARRIQRQNASTMRRHRLRRSSLPAARIPSRAAAPVLQHASSSGRRLRSSCRRRCRTMGQERFQRRSRRARVRTSRASWSSCHNSDMGEATGGLRSAAACRSGSSTSGRHIRRSALSSDSPPQIGPAAKKSSDRSGPRGRCRTSSLTAAFESAPRLSAHVPGVSSVTIVELSRPVSQYAWPSGVVYR